MPAQQQEKKAAGLESLWDSCSFVFIFILHYRLYCSLINDEPCGQLRSTTIDFSTTCPPSIEKPDANSIPNLIPQVEGTTDPSTVSCVDDDINNEGKRARVGPGKPCTC